MLSMMLLVIRALHISRFRPRLVIYRRILLIGLFSLPRELTVQRAQPVLLVQRVLLVLKDLKVILAQLVLQELLVLRVLRVLKVLKVIRDQLVQRELQVLPAQRAQRELLVLLVQRVQQGLLVLQDLRLRSPPIPFGILKVMCLLERVQMQHLGFQLVQMDRYLPQIQRKRLELNGLHRQLAEAERCNGRTYK
jgi:hypothetical protein